MLFATVCLSKKDALVLTAVKNTLPKQIHSITGSPRGAQLSIGNSQIEAIIDSGAEVNILLESKVPSHMKRIFRTPTTLQSDGSKVITFGKAINIALYTKKPIEQTVDDLLVDYPSTPICPQEQPMRICSALEVINLICSLQKDPFQTRAVNMQGKRMEQERTNLMLCVGDSILK